MVEIVGARVCGVTVGVGRTGFVREGLGLVGWSWSMVRCAFGFEIAGLRVGRSWFVLQGLGLVGWRWSVVVCA